MFISATVTRVLCFRFPFLASAVTLALPKLTNIRDVQCTQAQFRYPQTS